MAIIDFIKKQFIDIIEWTDDSRDTLSYRFPDEDKEIKNGAQLIVRESQVAQFVYLGQFGDTFGPGKHTLTTDNIPILTDLKGWKYGFETPVQGRRLLRHHAPVHRQQVGHGQSGDDARRRISASCALRAYGTYDFRVVDVEEVPEGSRRHRRSFPARRIRRHDALAHRQRVHRRARAARRFRRSTSRRATRELGEALLPLINPVDRRRSTASR